jgi:hypothetical protein
VVTPDGAVRTRARARDKIGIVWTVMVMQASRNLS